MVKKSLNLSRKTLEKVRVERNEISRLYDINFDKMDEIWTREVVKGADIDGEVKRVHFEISDEYRELLKEEKRLNNISRKLANRIVNLQAEIYGLDKRAKKVKRVCPNLLTMSQMFI